MKRALDIALALFGLTVAFGPMLLIALVVKLTSSGPVLYWSDRVGRDNRLFRMPKFRTMRTDTPEVAAHLLTDARNWMTPIGSFLRRTSLDELPQLWSILKGDLAIVGPRPALFNQHDLIALRTTHGIQELTPGLTGWAQIVGRNELNTREKVASDIWYAEHQSFWLDLTIILRTLGTVVHRQDHRAMTAAKDSAAAPIERSAAGPVPPANLRDRVDCGTHVVPDCKSIQTIYFADGQTEATR